MNYFLDDYVATLSSERQRKAAFLLEDAKIQKVNVDLLAEQLTDRTTAAVSPAVIGRHTPGRLIRYDVFQTNFNSVDVRMRNLYALSNQLSQLLYANIDMLTSEVFKLENEITSLEKIANNYGFVTAQGSSYHRSFIESFDSEINRQDPKEFSVPDRNGVAFGVSEQANLRTQQGVLSLSGGRGPNSKTAPLIAKIIESNVTGLVIQSNDISLTTTPHFTDGWRMVVGSPVRIDNASTSDERFQGAWVKIEYMTSTPSPTSEITITPLGSSALDLLSVNLYESEATSDYRSVLSAPVTLDRPIVVHFPTQLVHKFEIVINQSVYTRVADVKTEVYYQEMIYNQIINTANPTTAQKRKKKSHIHHLRSWKKSYKRQNHQKKARLGMLNGKSQASERGVAMATEHANIEFPQGFFGGHYGPMDVRNLNSNGRGLRVGDPSSGAQEDLNEHAFIRQLQDTAVYKSLMNTDSYSRRM